MFITGNRIVFLLSFLLSASPKMTLAQKPIIDSGIIYKWPNLNEPNISDDGNYVVYNIRYGFSAYAHQKTVVQSTRNNWKITIDNTTPSGATFSANSQYLFLFKTNDTLGIITLGASGAEYIPHVNFFKSTKNNDFIAYSLSDSHQLVIRNLITHQETFLENIIDFTFNHKGTTMLLLSQKDDVQNLSLVNLLDNKNTVIWKGTQVMSRMLNEKGTQVVFFGKKVVNGKDQNALWYYQDNYDSAKMFIDSAHALAQNIQLDQGAIEGYSKDGDQVFLKLKEVDCIKTVSKGVNVDVWNYKDDRLQSQQLSNTTSRPYLHVLNIRDKNIIRLENENDEIRSPLFSNATKSESGHLLVFNTKGDINERYWNESGRPSVFLVSTLDGSRTRLRNINWRNQFSYQLSPNGKYVIFYESDSMNYFSYEIATRTYRNITSGIKTKWSDEDEQTPISSFSNIRSQYWLKDDEAIFLYDRFDIWKVDPRGRVVPSCTTNGYGLKHNIVLRFALLENSGQPPNIGDTVYLVAFDKQSKKNGFYNKVIGTNDAPRQLTMEDIICYIPDYYVGLAPIKARNAHTYLVQKETAKKSPNYFITEDFKIFHPLSDVYPEQNYNWLTAELITWRSTTGRQLQGVLYKPENFDFRKKYPMIIFLYEKKSDELNKYHTPQPTYGQLEIAPFVSKGYLVFTPDIDYALGKPGESALNSISSAVNYVITKPWVDDDRIGVYGHSFGGFETNYLVTHTKRFAAAVSAAGLTDFVSVYGSLIHDGISNQFFPEIHQLRIGYSLWQRPDLYLSNSPIFQADKIATPLLMMHNKLDNAVPFTQGIELFTALRRLKKRVWMLQYDNEGHSLSFDTSTIDYNIRVNQFFDHYLKNYPAPKWMTHGIPAKLKGVETGYDLDPSGSCAQKGSNICKVCEKWNEQYKRTPGMFTKPASEWRLDKEL